MRKSSQLICHLGPFILMSALLVGCGTRGPVQQTMFDIITLSSGQAIELAATIATFSADQLAFEGFVNDTDSVLINVEEVAAGELSLVFLAEVPFTGSFGRLVFRRLGGESGTVTVAPLQPGDDQAPVPVEMERSSQDEKPPLRGNPPDLGEKQVDASGIAYVPDMANYPLGDLDQSGKVSLADVLALRAILFGENSAPSDFELYHGNFVVDGVITFDDIARLAAKATGAAPATLHVTPKVFSANHGEMVHILLGNAGSGMLPAVQVSGVRGDAPQNVTPSGAAGQVYRLVSDGTTTGVVFEAGEAGVASSLNNLLSSEAVDAATRAALAENAAQFIDYQRISAYLEGEGFTTITLETAHVLYDNQQAFADIYQASYGGTDGSASLTYAEANSRRVAFAMLSDQDGHPIAEVRIAGNGELVVSELSLVALGNGMCLKTIGPLQTSDPTERCKERCREDFCNIDFAFLEDLETPCKVLAYLHCNIGAGAGNCDPPPPPPPPSCRSCGDPHLYTFDGLAYDFQAAGEFVLIESASGDLVMQARQEPWPSSDAVAVNTAVAMNVGGDRVGVYLGRSPALYVNGEATELSGSILTLPNGGTVADDGERYLVTWSDGSVVSARLRGSYLDIGAELAEARRGQVSGLLGNFDGDRGNDIRVRNGASLDAPVAFRELYDVYGNSWRISQAEALFDYEAGSDTGSYTLLDFPRRFVSADTLSETAYQAAKQVCEAAGVTDLVALENCILDVAVTGDASFAEGAAEVPPSEGVLEVCPEPVVIVGDINEDQIWGPNIANCTDYLVTGRGFIFGNLTIQPGTRVTFEEGASLVNSNGSLQAIGTPDAPILFVGANSVPGYWQGIVFSTDSPLNELSYAIVDGAGSGRLGYGDTNDTSVGVRGDARVKISNTTIRNSAGYGLRVVGADANISGFANNRFEGNAEAPLQLHASHLGVIDGETLYDAPENPNGNRYIEVARAGRISSDQTWPNTSIPIRFIRRTGDISRTLLEARVIIEPGATLEFTSNAGLNVTTGGALTAQGSEGAPITFRGVDSTKGNWVGIIINTNDNRNVLDHVLVSDGGQSAPGTGSQANIRVLSGGRLELRNSTIRNSEGCGLYKHPNGMLVPDPDDPDADDPNNTFEDNAGDDIC